MSDKDKGYVKIAPPEFFRTCVNGDFQRVTFDALMKIPCEIHFVKSEPCERTSILALDFKRKYKTTIKRKDAP